ncbi:MAG TPA: hypothetical protein VGJ16_05880, partial [Pirellulales bacterium]
GGGGYGGGGLPAPGQVLELWGGSIREHAISPPAAPQIVSDDGSGEHRYALVALGPQGGRTAPSASVRARGLARLAWDSTPGADSYLVVRDGTKFIGPLRIEGSRKEWTDKDD